MRHQGLLIRGGTLLCLAGLATCTAVTTETPGGFPALDATAQGRRYSAMMEALEKNLSGQPALWAENNRVRGSVITLGTLHTSVYGWCREYEERIATSAPIFIWLELHVGHKTVSGRSLTSTRS
jgi:surface antigen